MSVWLTPDLRPFIGGTYFPPRDHGGRPGLKTVLMRIIDQVGKVFFFSSVFEFQYFCNGFMWSLPSHLYVKTINVSSQWRNNRPTLESNGNKILEALRKGTAIASDAGSSPAFAPDVAKRCFQQLANSYEEEYGGFREAPKFPSPGKLENTVEMCLWAPCLTLPLSPQWIWCSSCHTGVWIAPPQKESRLFRWLYTHSAWWRWEASTTTCHRFLHFLLQKYLELIYFSVKRQPHISYLWPVWRNKQNNICLQLPSLSFQGFHRYSTDSSWHVPHFEKMLYDQAQLAVAYITASQVRVWIRGAASCCPYCPQAIHQGDARQPAPSLPENRSEAANEYTP